MSFSISISNNGIRSTADLLKRTFNPEFDEPYIFAAKALEDAGFKMSVSGFGIDQWPCSLSYDGSIVASDMPLVIRNIESRIESRLGFLSLERTVRIVPQDQTVELTLVKTTPGPISEKTGPKEITTCDSLLMQLRIFMSTFIENAEEICPSVTTALRATHS